MLGHEADGAVIQGFRRYGVVLFADQGFIAQHISPVEIFIICSFPSAPSRYTFTLPELIQKTPNGRVPS